MSKKRESNQTDFCTNETDVVISEKSENGNKDVTYGFVGEQFAKKIMPNITEPEAEKTKKSSKKKFVFYLFFVLLCVGSLVYTAYLDFAQEEQPLPFSQIIDVLLENWYYFVFALVSLAMFYVCEALRHAILLHGVTKKFPFGLSMSTGAITRCYDYVTPFGAGGQPFGLFHLTKNKVPGGKASAVVLTALFLQQLSFVILSAVSLALMPLNQIGVGSAPKIMAIVGMVGCLIIPFTVIIFSLMPKTTGKLLSLCIRFGAKIKLVKDPNTAITRTMEGVKNNAESIKSISTNKVVFILAFLISIASWCAQCSIAYFTLRSFGYDIPNVGGFLEWLQIAQVCLVLYISVSFIPTPGNAGASELSFYFIFTQSLSAGLGFTALTVWRVLSYYSYILIGFLVVLLGKLKERKQKGAAFSADLDAIDFDRT